MSCCNENKADVTFACLLAANIVDVATIEWQPSNSHAKTFPATQQKIGRNFYSASQLTVRSEELKRTPYKCLVNQKGGTGEPPSATIQYNDCILQAPKPIQVNILTPSCGEQDAETILELVCFLWSLGPGKAYVEWLKNGGVDQGSVQVSLAADQGKRSSYSRFVRQNITKESWDRGDIYTCKVARSVGSPDVIMYNTSKCQACYASLLKPTVSIIKPSYRDLLEGTANVTCAVVGFGLENIEVTWDVDGKPSTMGQKTMRGKDASGAQEIKNTHMVSLEQWRNGARFTCKVAGGCYEEVIKQLTIKRETQTMEPSITVSKANLDVSLQSAVALILVCNVNGFSPEEISISWKKDNNFLNETLYDNGPVTPAGKGYTTYSILKIGRDEAGGKGGSYSCVVHHSSSNQPLTKSEKVPIDFLQPAPPQVTAFHTSEDGGRQKLVCFATDFYPKNIDIEWATKGHRLSCSTNSSALVPLGNGKFQKTCSWVLSGEEWREPEIYTCTVNHSSTNTMIKKDLHYSGMAPLLNKTAIKMQPPPFEDLFINKSAILTCMMPVVNATINSTVSWTMDGEPANTKAVTTKFLNETNSTSWIYGQLRVNLTEWKTTVKFTCSIQNGLGETKRHFERRNGTMKPPKVYLQQQSSNDDLNVTLFCVVRDFYPGEIFVKWEEEKNGMSLKGYDAHGLKCDHEKQRCSLVSILEVPTSKWLTGVSYACLVAHVSSENITIRRTNSLSDSWDCAIMGTALCDIRNENEDEYSELEEANSVWNKVSTFMVLFTVAIFYGGLVTFIKVK